MQPTVQNTTTESNSTTTENTPKMNQSHNGFSFKEGDWTTRLFYVNELHKPDGGRPRFLAINYSINEKTQEVKYGAAIYQHHGEPDLPSKKKLEHQLRNTARERLKKKPVTTQLTLEASTLKDLHSMIRRLLFSHGVCDTTHKHSDTSSLMSEFDEVQFTESEHPSTGFTHN